MDNEAKEIAERPFLFIQIGLWWHWLPFFFRHKNSGYTLSWGPFLIGIANVRTYLEQKQ